MSEIKKHPSRKLGIKLVGKWYFGPPAAAKWLRDRSMKCLRKEFCLACAEDVMREVFEAGRSGAYK